MTLRHLLKDRILPPLVVDLLRDMRRAIRPHGDGLSLAPLGWQTPLSDGRGFETEAVLACDLEEWRSQWVPFERQLALAPSAPLPGDPVTWANFACALAVAANGRPALRVLDYGGGLCPARIAAKAILPRTGLEFHCKEVPAMARIGRELHPEVEWHGDDACFSHEFDLVVLGSVLQYERDWPRLLQRAAMGPPGHVYIANTPVVTRADSFVALQRVQGASLLALQFNRRALLEAASAAGLRPVREFPPREHEPIAGAPERPTYFSCLFERTGARP